MIYSNSNPELRYIATVHKVLAIKTLVIYTKDGLPYHPSIQGLGIKAIWLKAGQQKALTWCKNPEMTQN